MFPQLYTITSYSLLSSTIRIAEFVKKAKQFGYEQLGIADINVLHGAVEFYEACQSEGIQPIIGMTLDYTPETTDQTKKLIFYAKDHTGYQNLMQISSLRMTKNGQLKVEEFSKFLSHLFVIMPADKGIINDLPGRSSEETEKEMSELLRKADKDSFFIGASFMCNPSTDAPLFDYIKKQKYSLLALQETRYLIREDGFALRVLEHIEAGTAMQLDLRETEIDGPYYLRKPGETQIRLNELLGAEAVDNAVRVAEGCQFELPLHQKLLPHYPVPNELSAGEYLRKLCFERLPDRVPEAAEVYKERLEKELTIIHNMGFDDYFLIVWDVMAFAHQQKIVTGAGRGSAAGSLVSYVLSITDVDPIQYNLLFERFLNPERYSMPDIDLDIPDNRREQVLAYVQKKYGHFHMAQIATFGTMAAKMVLRDAARVFGLSQSESNRWSQAVPNTLKITLKQAYQESKKLVELVESSDTNRLLFDTAVRLEGLPRHVSTHAAGVVITDQNLLELVPLQTGTNDILLTQFTMNDVEKIGLLKMDFLGLRNLSIIDDTLKSVKRVYKEELKLSEIPLDDEKSLELFQRGETSGVFQFESAGIRNVLRKLGPTSIEDIAAVNALYRPGPMQNIDLFIRRKKGLEPIDYPDASLQPILENTYGVIVYQEQIMQVAAKMAGFSLGQADILRRAISKKKKEILDQERRHFVQGGLAQGYTEETANMIYDYIERFANYGFNRSHAFAYSFIGFQMAYLKVHYPAAFYAALLHSVRHNPNKIKEYISEAKKNEIKIIPPSINHSHYSFLLKDANEITFGFSSLKGIRRDFIQDILAERKENGHYQSFDQFLFRISSKWRKKETIEPLIAIGAFDELSPNRRQLDMQLESKIQNILYSGGSSDLFETLELKEEEVQDYSLEDKLAQEEQYLGVYLSGHPTEEFTKLAKLKQIIPISDVVEKQTVRILVYVKNVRTIRTKKGEQMAFVEGDDSTGSISLTLFPTVFRSLRQTVHLNQVYYVEGKVEKSTYNQELQVLVNEITEAAPIEKGISEKTCYLKIEESEGAQKTLQEIRRIIQHYPGSIPVVLFYADQKKKIILDNNYWITENTEVQQQFKALLGETNVVFK
ncbi:DNA polymerase III subunit alpha [Enterococcus sp. BWB1-3]|uniref:DNA polymerase III subunit alpha n=1 Tax=Enterococcus sp. BWB1-3 TaxID=2787713 RepID=UPI0019216960|nr:DNA polymerase III subunit alpha [Enterococcus sp. BWB1-3]MBL1229413.1 DNA polymerase III subunit alpha [Enterococcus sp. BWB1-3]